MILHIWSYWWTAKILPNTWDDNTLLRVYIGVRPQVENNYLNPTKNTDTSNKCSKLNVKKNNEQWKEQELRLNFRHR